MSRNLLAAIPALLLGIPSLPMVASAGDSPESLHCSPCTIQEGQRLRLTVLAPEAAGERVTLYSAHHVLGHLVLDGGGAGTAEVSLPRAGAQWVRAALPGKDAGPKVRVFLSGRVERRSWNSILVDLNEDGENEEVGPYGASAVVVDGDWDLDTHTDLAVASGGQVEFWYGDGKGGLQQRGAAELGVPAPGEPVGDLNGDGRADFVFVTNRGVEVLWGSGSGERKRTSVDLDGWDAWRGAEELVLTDRAGTGLVDEIVRRGGGREERWVRTADRGFRKEVVQAAKPKGAAARMAADSYAASPWGTYFYGQINNVAGAGFGGNVGDGGIANSTIINQPKGIALDASGNVYFTEYSLGTIRKVDRATGIITTLCNSISFPNDLSYGPDGYLYVASSWSNRVYRVDITSGTATVVAGTGTGGFSGDGGPATSAMINLPTGIFVDARRRLYISVSDHRVRMVDLATGTISTVAGNGSCGYSGNDGPALAAQLCAPRDVVVDSQGNLYIADSGIRRVSALTGMISAWGYVPSALSLAIDSADNIYSTETAAIRRTSQAGAAAVLIGTPPTTGYSGDGGLASAALIDRPEGIVVSAAGDVFFSDTFNNRVRVADYSSPHFSISTDRLNLRAAAGTGQVTLTVSSPTGGWTATSDSPWLTVTPASGAGTATLSVSGMDNPSGDSRAGRLTIGPFQVLVVQSAAKVTLSPAVAKVTVGGGVGTFNLTVAPSLAWTATTTDTWLSVTPTSGSGNATLTFTATANSGVPGRMASVTVAGKSFAVIQAGISGSTSAWSSEYGQIFGVAGTGVPGYNGEPMQTFNAQLNKPWGIAMNAVGDIYVADKENHIIRKVYQSTSLIQRIAGTRQAGFNGDVGAGVMVQLNSPTSVAVDESGTIYVADTGNNRIRALSAATNDFSTILNGLDSGPLSSPSRLAIGRDNDLYFMAIGGLYRVVRATGNAERVPQLASTPLSYCIDRNGDIYYGTRPGQGPTQIRKLTLDSGQTELIYQYENTVDAGSPGSLSVDLEGNIFVLDGQSFLRRIDAITRVRTDVTAGGNGTSPDGGPAIEAKLNATEIFTDPAGNVFIADAMNNRLRMVDLSSPQYTISATGATVNAAAGSGTVSLTVTPGSGGWQATSNAAWLTVAPASGTGNATLTYSYPANPYFLSREGLITIGTKKFRLMQVGPKVTFTPATLELPPTAGSAQVSFTVDPPISWWAAPAEPWISLSPRSGTGDGTITMTYESTGEWTGRIGKFTIGEAPFYFTQAGLGGAMTLWGKEFGQINTIAGTGLAGPVGSPLVSVQGTEARLNYPTDVAVDEGGNVYIADSGNLQVRSVEARFGNIRTFLGGGTGPDGYGQQYIYLGSPLSIALHRTGDFYVSVDWEGRIRRLSAYSRVVSTVWQPTPSDPYTRHPSIAVDPDGRLYMAEPDLFRVRKLNVLTGEIYVVAGNGLQGFTGDGGLATQARFNRPTAVAVDSEGNLYITDSDNKRVRRVSAATGIVTTVAGNGSGTFSGDGGLATLAGLESPGRLAIDAAGNLFIAETGRVRRVDAVTGIIQTIAGGQNGSGFGNQGLATQASLGGDLGITVDRRGNLYIADRSNHLVRFVDRQSPTYTISTNSATVPALGGSATFNVTVSPAGSSWGVTSNVPWLTFDRAYGAGSGTVTYRVAPNTSGGPRRGILRVGMHTIAVLQQTPGPDRIGIYANGEWALDLNGNGTFEGNPTDRYVRFGIAPYQPVLGDWGATGRKSLGITSNGMWYLDLNQNRQWDGIGQDGYMGFGGDGWTPVTGDWNGDGRTKAGVYQQGSWYLDYNGDGRYDSSIDRVYPWLFCPTCVPVVGDWNGDGKDEIGIYAPNGTWALDMNGDGSYDAFDKSFGFGTTGFEPLVGDWNGDGRAKIGIYRDGEWYLDYNGNFQWEGLMVDRGTYFGAAGWKPVTGDWNGDGRKKLGIFRDGQWYLDFNGNFQFDGAATDRMYSFGAAGQTPIVGIW
jgi:hypothetical protein